MARNRFRGRGGPDAGPSRLQQGLRLVGRIAKPILGTAVVLGGLTGVGVAGWKAVQRSPYFQARQIDAEGSAHLTREEVVARAGLDEAVNLFKYETEAAVEALLAHPWVATATVEKSLPDHVRIRVEERRPEGIVVLGGLYLVDGTGEPFAQPTPAESVGLPLVTGVDRAAYQADPKKAHRHIRDALAVARLYAQSPLARRRPLSDVHLGEGGRTELVVGRTRVVLGRTHFKQKLDGLVRIFDQLDARKMDATYILMSADLRRAIVKEVPRQDEQAGSLTLRAGDREGASKWPGK
ncbi:MAG: FtsQ-type POTRA domain-containing protein [Myxococcales bacterium]|nr:FtsQ-type POTRA domain-containing protein [Myxococcales bacterium]